MEDIKSNKSQTVTWYSGLLFRGHSCESWKLDSTLERYIDKQFSIKKYHLCLLKLLPVFVAYTGKEWPLETSSSINDFPEPPPGYEFMVYLRHLGVPAPL